MIYVMIDTNSDYHYHRKPFKTLAKAKTFSKDWADEFRSKGEQVIQVVYSNTPFFM